MILAKDVIAPKGSPWEPAGVACMGSRGTQPRANREVEGCRLRVYSRALIAMP